MIVNMCVFLAAALYCCFLLCLQLCIVFHKSHKQYSWTWNESVYEVYCVCAGLSLFAWLFDFNGVLLHKK